MDRIPVLKYLVQIFGLCCHVVSVCPSMSKLVLTRTLDPNQSTAISYLQVLFKCILALLKHQSDLCLQNSTHLEIFSTYFLAKLGNNFQLI